MNDWERLCNDPGEIPCLLDLPETTMYEGEEVELIDGYTKEQLNLLAVMHGVETNTETTEQMYQQVWSHPMVLEMNKFYPPFLRYTVEPSLMMFLGSIIQANPAKALMWGWAILEGQRRLHRSKPVTYNIDKDRFGFEEFATVNEVEGLPSEKAYKITWEGQQNPAGQNLLDQKSRWSFIL